MKQAIRPLIQWLKSPWPLLISMAIAGATALTLSLLWIQNESNHLPAKPIAQSLVSILSEGSQGVHQ